MGEVKYYINYKNFREYGVYVSDSIGITDALERKDVQSYNWAEYHGSSPDLRKPKFKERKIELKCFIVGDDWAVMNANFQNFKNQFTKGGTQRIHIKPFDFTVLPYEVFMQDDIVLEKKFREGRMVGTFSINLIEPNPIKRVLKTSLDSFKLSYEIDSETEIFFGDGTKQTGRGNVSLTKDYSKSSYENSGISLVSTSGVNSDYFEVYAVPEKTQAFQFSTEITLQSPKDVFLCVIGRTHNNDYVAISVSSVFNGLTGKNTITLVEELNINDYGKFIFKVLDSEGNEIPGIAFENPRIETAEVVGEWQDMTGKEKIIIIAGNIEDMKNLQTPAEIIWQKI